MLPDCMRRVSQPSAACASGQAGGGTLDADGLDQAAEQDAGEGKQWSVDEAAVDLVDPVLAVEQAVDRGEAASEGCGASRACGT